MTTPLLNYSAPGNPFWLRTVPQNINVSTINASTITTDTLAVFPNAYASGSISGSGSQGVQMLLDTNQTGANAQIALSAGTPTQKTFLITVPGSQIGAYLDYNYQGRDIGSIGFLPGAAPGQGAVNLVDEQNDFLFLGQGNLIFNTTQGGAFYTERSQMSTLSAPALSNVSSINGSVYPPTFFPATFVPVSMEPGFTGSNAGYVVPGGPPTPIASVNVTPGSKYRITMFPTFINTAAPAAGDWLQLYGSSGAGPNDTLEFISLNLNWCGTGLPIATPGLANNYGQCVSGIMTADASPYYIYGLLNIGCAVSTFVQFGNVNSINVEKLS